MIACPSCGKENEDGANFCYNCGSALQPGAKPVPPVAGVTPTGVIPQWGVRTVPPPGVCFYHPFLPSYYVCSRCGRPTCFDCTKVYQQLSFCPECYWALGPRPRARR